LHHRDLPRPGRARGRMEEPDRDAGEAIMAAVIQGAPTGARPFGPSRNDGGERRVRANAHRRRRPRSGEGEPLRHRAGDAELAVPHRPPPSCASRRTPPAP
jgi:hypothetical protein